MVVCHHSGPSSGWSLIDMVCQGGLSLGWSVIRMVSHQGGLLPERSFGRVVTHQGGLSGWSVIGVIAHLMVSQGGLSSG